MIIQGWWLLKLNFYPTVKLPLLCQMNMTKEMIILDKAFVSPLKIFWSLQYHRICTTGYNCQLLAVFIPITVYNKDIYRTKGMLCKCKTSPFLVLFDSIVPYAHMKASLTVLVHLLIILTQAPNIALSFTSWNLNLVHEI